jgi:hypothetical protein
MVFEARPSIKRMGRFVIRRMSGRRSTRNSRLHGTATNDVLAAIRRILSGRERRGLDVSMDVVGAENPSGIQRAAADSEACETSLPKMTSDTNRNLSITAGDSTKG